APQPLSVLEAANLISTVWHGREKLHYLNPVPLHEIQERWIDKFETPRLRVLSAVRHRAEEKHMTTPPTFVYVTYVRATPEQVWEALTRAAPPPRPAHTGTGVGGPHQRRPHRPVLGAPHRVGLAAGFDLAARADRWLRH